MKNKPRNCPDCGVAPGEFHKDGCDVERCPNCGGQRISCDCNVDELTLLPWTGLRPGAMECREFGWYAKSITGSNGSVWCDKSDPRASEDLNRLYVDAVWDREAGRFMR